MMRMPTHTGREESLQFSIDSGVLLWIRLGFPLFQYSPNIWGNHIGSDISFMERCFDFTMFPVSFVFFSSSFLCLCPHLVVSNLEKVMSVVLGGFGCWLVFYRQHCLLF